MATYKTPDVYIKEISIFPPSVAEVETAIPCFIGYTEKAKKIKKNDLHLKAEKIKSIADFNELFGSGPPLSSINVVLDANNNASEVDLTQNYYLYDSVRMFFNNGGGKCYIISSGLFGEEVKMTDTRSGAIKYGLEEGLKVLKKEDEPTMIVFPDAVLLSGNGLYDLQQKALLQCGALQDRVLIADLKNSGDLDDDVDEFRGKIGINNLKYGAAYTPWLKVMLPKTFSYESLIFKRGNGSVLNLKNLTSDSDIIKLTEYLEEAIKAKNDIKSNIIAANLSVGNSTLAEEFEELVNTYNANQPGFANIDAYNPDFRKIFRKITKIANDIKTFQNLLTAPDTANKDPFILKTDIDTIITNYIDDSLQLLVDHSNELPFSTGTLHIFTATDLTPLTANFPNVKAATQDATVATDYAGATTAIAKGKLAVNAASDAFIGVQTALTEILNTAISYIKIFDTGLEESFSVYKSIRAVVNDSLSELPPSGAIAGIYAFVDSNRGVWKAPANVSLNGVAGLTEVIDFDDQKDLNVDVNAGKSINAIRSFSGKGILVWGARTLAGNDNEWRYISVRRLFNMVEESVKKSTYWAVFEPNDANTWIKVKGMIENYLFQKWRDGALAGAVPEDAYFVKVGLGLTMTAQDILEGRMNVEIGMAAVRPAEFIILKFAHKMQES